MSAARSRSQREEGSAVVDFVLVSVLVVLLFLGVVQLGVALHVRNTLVAAAAEGARYAANADREPDDGAQRARALIEESFGSDLVQDVAAGFEDVAGSRTVVVEVRARLPLVGLLGPDQTLVVRGHAWDEGQP
ncbi:MAG: pilus assembly protein [Actinomycetia bacterium]|nr:pilus assembly protein [Actinomycetes bacterium]